MSPAIVFEVNGHNYIINDAGQLTLLDYLRDNLGLVGAKKGCNQGQCGTCTVLVDGKARRACMIPLARLNGSKVETIENLSREGLAHILQETFILEGAVQCGFCTPGMIMAAKSLLDNNQNPTEEEIKHALRFNLCRCTGYGAIVRAVKRASIILQNRFASNGFISTPPDQQSRIRLGLHNDLCLKAGSIIGASPVRKDARVKVTGSPLYADDLKISGMIYGKLLLSNYPHARINEIDISKAKKKPGVIKIITHKDIPGRNGFGLLNPHQPVLAQERVRFMGDPVAVVCAETENAAAAALKYIEVKYEPLPGIFTAEEGMLDEAISIHPQGNVMDHVSIRKGNTDRAFSMADFVITGEYSTPMVEHAYMEPEAALAELDSNGTVKIWTASQSSFAIREMIAASLDLPEARIRVIYTPAGGAFGGKEEPTVQIHCALGALLTGRPVKMTLSRQESLVMSTKRHAEKMYYRHAVMRSGKIIAVEARVIVDAGAYDSLSKPVVFRSGVVAAGPYDIPNVKVDSYGVYTNNPPGGAFRGFGSTQVAFSAEQQMDKIARVLKISPFELRRINGLAAGKKTITGQVIKNDCGYLKTLDKVEESLQKFVRDLGLSPKGKKIGIGIASAYKNVGLGNGKIDQAGAIIEIDPCGRVLLKVGVTDMGQGSDTVMAQIAAQETGIPYDEFDLISSDTALTLDGGVTTASRQTYISGHAVLGASRKFYILFTKFLQRAFNLSPGDYYPIKGGLQLKDSGFISYKSISEKAQSMKEYLVAEFLYTAPETYKLRENADHAPGVFEEEYNIHFAYCFGTQAAIVEVDGNSGEVRLLKVIAAQDLGRAIHPQNSRCQIEGAVAMGIGYGLSEEVIMNKGRMITENLAMLKLPKITNVPEMEIILVEEESDGPYGAKGMGEVPVNPTAPAIVNAIYDAVGIRVTDLPASKDKIIKLLKLTD